MWDPAPGRCRAGYKRASGFHSLDNPRQRIICGRAAARGRLDATPGRLRSTTRHVRSPSRTPAPTGEPMKKLFTLVTLLTIVVGAVGFHRGWFQLNCCAGGEGEK